MICNLQKNFPTHFLGRKCLKNLIPPAHNELCPPSPNSLAAPINICTYMSDSEHPKIEKNKTGSERKKRTQSRLSTTHFAGEVSRQYSFPGPIVQACPF